MLFLFGLQNLVVKIHYFPSLGVLLGSENKYDMLVLVMSITRNLVILARNTIETKDEITQFSWPAILGTPIHNGTAVLLVVYALVVPLTGFFWVGC